MMPEPVANRGELLSVAITAALKAGELLRQGFGTTYQIGSKRGRHDLVTAYDKRSEEMILGVIKSRYPNHHFLAEESGASHAHDPSIITWIIDPLDGTVNFAHSIPMFSISIAAALENQIVCGVVYQPLLHELFTAEKGKGAFLNGEPLSVSSTKKLEESMLVTGFPYNVGENPGHCIEHFNQILRFGVPVRRLGSAAIDLSYVAAGRFDAFWEVRLSPWDMAAAKLFIEEAGGKLTHYNGEPHCIFREENLVASNGHLHAEMLRQLKDPT